ncbi:MAG: adenine nucleotide alpha hydrolase [Rhodospirillales bacterium]|nr:adenine nucleotide alpha hydrolase [Rhodospirillales bacterium]
MDRAGVFAAEGERGERGAAPRAYVSWSSGKDSAFALLETRRLGLAEIAGVLTTVSEVHDRVSMHGVRTALLERQVAALGLSCVKVKLPSPCSNEIYEERMAEAVARIKGEGVRHVVFGDLFLEDVRAYREKRLAAAGMRGIFPLWRRDTAALAREMIAQGFVAHLVTIDPGKLDRGFAGRAFDEALLAALPGGVDPCGENGEFHTFVSAGPMFAAPIAVAPGEVVEREGFVFADFL